jgi:hypothetical protein
LDVLPLLRVEYAGRVPKFNLADLSIHFGHGAEQHRALAGNICSDMHVIITGVN